MLQGHIDMQHIGSTPSAYVCVLENVNVICLSRYFRSLCRSWRMRGHRLVYRLLGLQDVATFEPSRSPAWPTQPNCRPLTGRKMTTLRRSLSFLRRSAGRKWGTKDGDCFLLEWAAAETCPVLLSISRLAISPSEVSNTTPSTGWHSTDTTIQQYQNKHNLKMALCWTERGVFWRTSSDKSMFYF